MKLAAVSPNTIICDIYFGTPRFEIAAILPEMIHRVIKHFVK